MRVLRAYIREGISTATIMGLGDLLAQFAIEKKTAKTWDCMRTARFSAIGLIYIGPSLKKWYRVLDGLVPTNDKPILHGVKKMLIDQLAFTPPFNLLILYLISFSAGESLNTIMNRIKRNYVAIMIRCYMIWPAVQLFNFSIIPIEYKVIFNQIAAVFWNCYLSTILNN